MLDISEITFFIQNNSVPLQQLLRTKPRADYEGVVRK